MSGLRFGDLGPDMAPMFGRRHEVSEESAPLHLPGTLEHNGCAPLYTGCTTPCWWGTMVVHHSAAARVRTP